MAKPPGKEKVVPLFNFLALQKLHCQVRKIARCLLQSALRDMWNATTAYLVTMKFASGKVTVLMLLDIEK